MKLSWLKRIWTKSIARQLMLGIALVHAVLMTIFVIDLADREKTFLIDLSKKQAIGLAETLATNGTSWVLSQDIIGMQEIISSQSGFPGLKYAIYLDTKGKVLSFTDIKQIGRYLDDDISKTMLKAKVDTLTLIDNSHFIDIASPITANNQHIGWARVGISRKGISDNINHVTRNGIIYTFFAIAIGTIFAWYMSRSLTTDIRTLVNRANRLQAGEEAITFNLDREDELGKLADNFQNLNEKLDEKVRLRTQQISEANTKLEQVIVSLKKTQSELIEAEKMAALGGLVAGVAHEINTPVGLSLTGISHLQTILEELVEKYKNNEMEEQDFRQFTQDAEEVIKASLSSLRRAADQIRSFKQVAADQTHYEQRVFDVKEYVQEVLLSLQNKLKQTKHNIIIDIEDNLIIRSYPGAVSQIITNLITNSLMHAFDKGAQGEIIISMSKQDGQLEIVYSDNGKGIDIKHRDKIFEPFYTTGRNRGGTGLGLNILHSIVFQSLKGTIKAEYPEQGVRFVIQFPIT